MIFWTWCTYTFLSWSKDSILTVRFKITGAQALNTLQLQIQCQITYCSDIRVRDALALSLKGFLSCECDNLCWWGKTQMLIQIAVVWEMFPTDVSFHFSPVLSNGKCTFCDLPLSSVEWLSDTNAHWVSWVIEINWGRCIDFFVMRF